MVSNRTSLPSEASERVLRLFKRRELLSPEVFPLVCPLCGGELKIIAFLTEADSFQRILNHVGEPATPPRIEPARAPPDWLDADFDQTAPNESESAEPIPEFEFDQTVSW